ncbi:MAG: hypothetical protein IPL01_13875 [Acidobacteria bacterium]|nr:hypothetical protein [Acidobacteriota bacterium]
MCGTKCGTKKDPLLYIMPGKKDRYYRIRNGKIYARVTFTDAAGRRRDVMKLAESKTHARELSTQMYIEFQSPRLVYYRR